MAQCHDILYCNTLQGHTRAVNAIAISGDEEWLISGSADGTVRTWSLDTGILHDVIDLPGPVTDLVLSLSNSTVALAMPGMIVIHRALAHQYVC